MPATSYFFVKDKNRVKDFDPNKTYRVPFETPTGHFKTALARFSEDGWEYLHLDYNKWLPLSDGEEIFTIE